jgi:hypothetical protein
MSILERFTKQPAEVKDYDVDYAPWLDPMTDTLTAVSTAVICTTNAEDTALEIDSVERTDKQVKLWISGGTDGQKYKITIQATTAGGRLDESELVFTVKDF